MTDRAPSILHEFATGLTESDCAKACDSHIHINDPRYGYAAGADLHPPPATVDQYSQLQARLGTGRVVVVQPSSYGADNSCTLDAVAQIGSSARAVVVVDDSITDDVLWNYHARGARGVRFNLMRPSPVAICHLGNVASRISAMGWHVQLHAGADTIGRLGDVLDDLAVPVVFDHLGRLTHAGASFESAYSVIARLLIKGRAWVKLSGAELDGASEAPHYATAARIARMFIDMAPDKVVWGSNWPHPAVWKSEESLPDDLALLKWILRCAPDPHDQYRILVSNPAQLYGFD